MKRVYLGEFEEVVLLTIAVLKENVFFAITASSYQALRDIQHVCSRLWSQIPAKIQYKSV